MAALSWYVSPSHPSPSQIVVAVVVMHVIRAYVAMAARASHAAEFVLGTQRVFARPSRIMVVAMKGQPMVSETHVQELLESSLEDAHLVLEMGQLSVIDGASAEKDESALVVATARELRENHDVAHVNDEELTSIAALLDDRIAKLGA